MGVRVAGRLLQTEQLRRQVLRTERHLSRGLTGATRPDRPPTHSGQDAVHAGDCWAAARSGRCRPATRQQAIDALRQQVPPCVHCRPDTAFGILE
ncbi:DUF6233 domain-containing protein [Streptomyces sp. NPDC001848]|uniref:DUF6233 domain-containing protein n=1 Tax=Streptomyces sp. NPDC001848 TaxID=3364618 RepID=UPI0036C8F55F